MPVDTRHDVVVTGSTDKIGRAELLKLLAEIRPLDHFETDRFIAGQPLRFLLRSSEADALAMAEMLRASGAVVIVEPSPPEFAMPTAISLVSLDNEEPAPPAPAPAGTPARGVTALDDSRFQAPPIAQQSMELDAPAAPARPAPSYQPPPPADAPARPSARHATAPAPVEEPDEDDEPAPAPIPGRLFQGQLRRNPALRLAIGIALGLLIGYALSAPYQSRAERHVAQIRATANADRWRPLEEARANAARLDEEADDLASSAFLTTLAIWLGTAAAVTAGWFRVT